MLSWCIPSIKYCTHFTRANSSPCTNIIYDHLVTANKVIQLVKSDQRGGAWLRWVNELICLPEANTYFCATTHELCLKCVERGPDSQRMPDSVGEIEVQAAEPSDPCKREYAVRGLVDMYNVHQFSDTHATIPVDHALH